MNKNLSRIISVLKDSDKPLTKSQIRELGGKATKNKLRLLIKNGVIKKNKINTENVTYNKLKFYNTYELVK
jgi:ribosomal protein L19E